jgi:uncharacterized protein involved in exopolysaccharide biosynthesis
MRIRKRFELVSFLLALILAGGGYAVWKLYPGKFKAQARLQVATQVPRILFQTVETAIEDDYKRYQNTQLTLVKSQLVLNAALRDSGVRTYRMIREQVDPIAWLQDNLKVEFIAGSEVMEIALSGDDPNEVVGLVNAVQKAYMDEVVNFDRKLRRDRYDRLKKIKDRYRDNLKERRGALRNLTETGEGDDRLRVAGLEGAEWLRLYQGLWTQRVDLQMERAEAEARLARCKTAAGSATDPVRKEIERLEGRLADLIAREKVLDERREQMAHRVRKAADQEPKREELKDGIAPIEDVYRKVAAEVEALNVELEAPPRVRLIEEAAPSKPRGGVINAGL